MRKFTFRRIKKISGPQETRRGNIVVLSAGIMVVIFGFAAFSVDVGFITLTKTQMGAAADASALSAGLELYDAWGKGPLASWSEVKSAARQSAVDITAAHRIGEQPAGRLVGWRDVRFGARNWNPATGSYEETWDYAPYNMVKVTVRRSDNFWDHWWNSSDADGPLPLLFAPVIGHDEVDLEEIAVAVMMPGVGFRIDPSSQQTADVLPIALDEPSWEDLMDGNGSDEYSYNPDTGAVSEGSDGILELSLYPYGNGALPPGNRGTVDFGSSNNSTNDLKRQILYGLNASDLSYFGGELRFDNGPLYINGDTGISAGIKAQLEAIKGQPRAIPIFTEVSGNGNNATYTIIKFVGIRIVHVKLTGNPKTVIVQPAPFTDGTVIRGEGVVLEPDSILAPVSLLR